MVQVGSANIQARNTENGWVPLHEAASRGHKEVVKQLLSLNAPVNPRTKTNFLPSQLARNNNHIECAIILGKLFLFDWKASVVQKYVYRREIQKSEPENSSESMVSWDSRPTRGREDYKELQ